jgi:EAL domain-containing protein (putative c-di-GMP-specific phosphodiesterase class I)
LEKRQLELQYQPIIDSKAQTVVAFEALMRWNHPVRGTISPGEFIPVAEQTGLIVEIGAWSLRRACHDAATWPTDVRVTVNLSPVQFERGNIYQSVVNALESSGLDPCRLELEITEGVLLRDEATTSQALHSLRALGVRIALDDFGTAYASLSYLRQFPFDKIKIDRSFVRDLDHAKRSDCLAIISAVSSLARHLQMRTVVEGVETREQVDTVLGAGCDELQGFYFSRAVPASAVRSVISECRSKLAEDEIARSQVSAMPRRRKGAVDSR